MGRPRATSLRRCGAALAFLAVAVAFASCGSSSPSASSSAATHGHHAQRAKRSSTLKLGAIAAALTTWAAVKFLLSYFETNRLSPFGVYCIVAGIFCLIVFTI